MNKKIPGLDHLRALAITMVFLCHYRLFPHPAWVERVGSLGWTGVDLFFVLSGYLIASQIFSEMERDSFSLKTFYLKRFFRIFPAYWVVVALYFTIPGFREWGALPPLWRFLTFTQNLGLDLRYERTFSHAWSLCVEEQYYLFFPLIVLALRHFKIMKRSALLIIALVAAGVISRALSWEKVTGVSAGTDTFGALWYKWIYYPTYNRLDGLLAGISIAAIFQYRSLAKNLIEKHGHIILLAGLILAGFAWWLCLDQHTFAASTWGFPVIACAYGCVTASAVCPGSMLNKFRSRITSTLAVSSYSLYLVHKATIHLTQLAAIKLNISPESNKVFLASILLSILAAALLRNAIEKPFLRLRKKLLRGAVE